MNYIMTLIMLSLLLIAPSANGRYLLQPNSDTAEALRIYNMFLEGKTKSEIEQLIGHQIEENNIHQALDHVIYLTDRTQRSELGGRNFSSCRDSLIPVDQLDNFIESYRAINNSIQEQYYDMWDYRFSNRMSCDICQGNEACQRLNRSWQTQYFNSNPEYLDLRRASQTANCQEMAQAAQSQAETGKVLDGGTRINCPPNTMCLNFDPYWVLAFHYDFTQCREDYMICPDIDDNKIFVHPSCYHGAHGTNAIAEFNKKFEWLNENAASIIQRCEALPLDNREKIQALQNPSLINCLPGSETITATGLINVNPSEVMALQTHATTLDYHVPRTGTMSNEASRFDRDRVQKQRQIELIGYEIDRLRGLIATQSVSTWDRNLKRYVQTRKPNATISQAEYDSIPQQIAHKENERRAVQEQLISITRTQYERLPRQLQQGTYGLMLQDYIEGRTSTFDRRGYEIYNISDERLVEQSSENSAYPSNLQDHETLAKLVKEKIQHLILLNGRERNRSNESVNMLASAWTAQCMSQYLRAIGCSPRQYNLSPYCSECGEEIDYRHPDPATGQPRQSQSQHRQNFYKQLRCLDYNDDFAQVRSRLINDETRRHICSDNLSVSSRIFERTRPDICSTNQP